MDIGLYVFFVFICIYMLIQVCIICFSVRLSIPTCIYIFIWFLYGARQIAFCILTSPIIALQYILVFLYIQRSSCTNVMKNIYDFNSNYSTVFSSWGNQSTLSLKIIPLCQISFQKLSTPSFNPDIFRILVYSEPWHIENQRHIQNSGRFRIRGIFRILLYL